MTKTKTKTIDVNRNSPFFLPYDLMSPGIAIPGDDALEYARDMDDGVSQVQGKGKSAKLVDVGPALRELYSDILYRPRTLFRLTCNANQRKTVETVPGHLWGGEVAGPVPADVMVVGKMLGYDEIKARRNLVGPSGELLTEIFSELGVRDLDGWYVTTMVKCQHPDGGRDLKSGWVKAFRPVLQMEMRVVRPKYILCLGADAACEVLGRKVSVSGMDGRVEELTYPIHRTHDDPPEFHTALVMVCTHPAAVLAAPEQREQLEFSLGRFAQLVRGERFDLHEEGLDHRVVDNLDDLQNLVEEVIHSEESYLDPGVATIAIDAEWHGEHPQNAGSYLRTIQVSWAHKAGACIVLRHAGGAEAMPWDEVKPLLERMLKSTPGREVRICGHFLNADMEWLLYMGLDLRQEFEAAERWEDTKAHGGFDTGLAAHALRETGDYGLEKLALRHTTAPRWDLPLEKWKLEFCRQHKLKPKDLEGYGEIADDVLYPYAIYDADVTRRLVVVLNKMLDHDRFGNSCRRAFWVSMRAAPSVLEIHTTGLQIDRQRVDSLTLAYMATRTELEERVRTWARWPDFNINSVFQVREFLFGAELNGKRDKLDPNKVMRVRPPKARSLKLQPIYDTSKRPMLWTEVVQKGLQREKSPGTAKNVLALLAQESQAVKRRINGQVVEVDYSPQVSWIRDHRFIGHVLKSCLRPPVQVEDEEGEDDSFVLDVDGHYVYRGGLAGSICDDNRVRTHIYQTKETGRWSSARPALQNLSKTREVDYARILGANYPYPLRSMICASPGHCLVEADYIGAELYGMAVMSGDEKMIEHCRRNQLPEEDPDFYDIHSNIAVLSFGLKCPATKAGLKAAGKKELRNVAKAVVFGVAYGRGPKAIALSAKEQGYPISEQEAQNIIDTIFEMYPKLQEFFAGCQQRVSKPQWICGPFGRFRRFEACFDDKTLGDMQRQAMNFPIQGMIADVVSRAMDYLYHYRSVVGDIYRIVMQVHDAILLEVPNEHVKRVVREVLPHCMVRCVPIYPSDLAGRPQGTGPFYLGTDTEVCEYWGVHMMPDQCLARGFSPKLAHWHKQKTGWTHNDFPKQIWVPGQGLVSMEA